MKANEALIAWNPRGDVKVACVGTKNWSDGFSRTGGATYSNTRNLTADKSVLMLFIEFHTLVVRDGVQPEIAHKAFLAIDEYRNAIAPDIQGAED